ncbi:ABC transporter ATP-binding protein [Microbacterium pseudoresistens]|uniref:ABC-type dipeptide/oligopeptide/nickel transport system ATPase component n=1 Tax=Microbacterium pseudoresistens TaxID=640634 RepID=A0A7Y9JLU8_9MICO|nr:ABC transporter ATP-binding protein [Microbacterium pseudoresistens]NYD53710.1 ABC-type dipeptide/oligopeptide/nickel transport system ATPase component [Microbacterium pseudoresistens]
MADDSFESPLLEVEGLRISFRTSNGDVEAVKGVTLTIVAGERVGLVGESGSGKSALLMSIINLLDEAGRITDGKIRFDGQDLRAMRESQLDELRGRRISVVLQDPSSSLNPLMSIGRQLDEIIARHQPGLGRSARRSLAASLLTEVEIARAEERLDAYPHQFSGGMKQRVGIAMALANDPDLLLADEPTTALDVTTQAQIIKLLTRLAKERDMAVLFVTHNLGIVSEFCDRILVLYRGDLVEEGETSRLLSRPTHPYTRALIGAIPAPGYTRQDGALATIGGELGRQKGGQ